MKRLLPLLWLSLTVSGSCLAIPAEPPASMRTCSLDRSEATWLQQVLDGWTIASSRFLKISSEPLPWIIFFDKECEYHLNPDPDYSAGLERGDIALRFSGRFLPLLVRPHNGSITLPNGNEYPIQPATATHLYNDGNKTFFFFALPEVFRAIPQIAADSLLDRRLLSAAMHEIIHTRQLTDVYRVVRRLGEKRELPSRFDDNILEHTFRDSTGYTEMMEKEIELFYRAAATDSPGLKRALARQALEQMQRRRNRYFTGDASHYALLEDLFLNMEGIAEWVRFRHHQEQGAFENDQEIISFLRGRGNEWIQDEGLALLLLLDRFHPDWQPLLIGEDPASPAALLEKALEK